MSEPLTIEHKGYVLNYVDNQDIWRCYAIDSEAPTIGKLKAKIDAFVSRLNKLRTEVPAIYIGSDYSSDRKFEACEIVSVAAKPGYRNATAVWTTRDHDEKWRGEIRVVKDRKKLEAADLAPDTPEVRAMVVELRRLIAVADAAMLAQREYRKSIPRVDISTLEKDETDE